MRIYNEINDKIGNILDDLFLSIEIVQSSRTFRYIILLLDFRL